MIISQGKLLRKLFARCPISLNKIIYEPVNEKVIFKTKYNAYFKKNLKVYDPIQFIGLATQHIPIQKVRLIRYFGLYSSKSRGKWHTLEHVARHAPDGWKEQNGLERQEEDTEIDENFNEIDISNKKSKASWARLIAKVYEVAPLICAKCRSKMRVIAIITNEYEVIIIPASILGEKILRHLVKTGKSPPSVDEKLLNNRLHIHS